MLETVVMVAMVVIVSAFALYLLVAVIGLAIVQPYLWIRRAHRIVQDVGYQYDERGRLREGLAAERWKAFMDRCNDADR